MFLAVIRTRIMRKSISILIAAYQERLYLNISNNSIGMDSLITYLLELYITYACTVRREKYIEDIQKLTNYLTLHMQRKKYSKCEILHKAVLYF